MDDLIERARKLADQQNWVQPWATAGGAITRVTLDIKELTAMVAVIRELADALTGALAEGGGVMDDVERLALVIADERARWKVWGAPEGWWFVAHFDPMTSNRPIKPHGGAFRTEADATEFIESQVAQAALDALTAAGWRNTAGWRKVGPDELVVPREPTRKALQGLYDWLRKPDHAATFSLRDLEDWLHSRPSPVALRTLVDTLQTQEKGDD